jgi:hypothetical protein
MEHEKQTRPREVVLEPEYLTVRESCHFSRMGSTSLYSYFDIAGGPIKTALIRKRGAKKGKRLVSVKSLRQFLENGVEPEADIE